jgi:site-specific DNA-methyltransferase (adenine-specific)
MIENTILLGKWEEYINSIPDGFVNLVITDPPYGVTPHDWDKRPEWDFFMLQMARICGKDGQMWIFCRMPWVIDMHLAAVKHGWIFVQERIWQKQNGSGATVGTFRKIHENIWHYKRPDASTFNLEAVREPKTSIGDKSIKAGKGASTCQYMTNRVAYVDDGFRMPKSVIFCPNLHQSKESLGHSTQKPEAIIAPLVKYSSNEGNLVFDPFAGTGTTPAVSKKLGRRWLAIEMTQKWHAKAVARIDSIVVSPQKQLITTDKKGQENIFGE